MSDPIMDAALDELEDANDNIENAERFIKVMAEAGEDVSSEKAQLARMKARRQKLILALRSNGAKGTRHNG